MPTYSYEAIDDRGKTVSGMLEADSEDAASNAIAAQGLVPARVRPAGSASLSVGLSDFRLGLTRVKAQDLVLFTKQFSTMVRAAMPVLRMFHVLESQTENIKLRSIVAALARDVQEGAPLHEAFRRHPATFSRMYCDMIRAGEASGSLPEVLDRLIYIIDHEQRMKSDIKAACRYPLVVVALLGVAFLVLLTFVVPRFAKIFAKADLVLPLPTRICLLLHAVLVQHWPVILIVLGAVSVFLRYFVRTERGRYLRDYYMTQIPVVGSLFLKASMSRFASVFAILQASGVSVLDSLPIISETIGNAAISREFDRVKSLLVEGHGISDPLARAKFFTPMVVNMTAIGEESGNLDEMLREVATHYDAEVEYATKRLSDAIAPVLTIGLAVLVGFFALAIYLPMWDIAQMVRR